MSASENTNRFWVKIIVISATRWAMDVTSQQPTSGLAVRSTENAANI